MIEIIGEREHNTALVSPRRIMIQTKLKLNHRFGGENEAIKKHFADLRAKIAAEFPQEMNKNDKAKVEKLCRQ